MFLFSVPFGCINKIFPQVLPLATVPQPRISSASLVSQTLSFKVFLRARCMCNYFSYLLRLNLTFPSHCFSHVSCSFLRSDATERNFFLFLRTYRVEFCRGVVFACDVLGYGTFRRRRLDRPRLE